METRFTDVKTIKKGLFSVQFTIYKILKMKGLLVITAL